MSTFDLLVNSHEKYTQPKSRRRFDKKVEYTKAQRPGTSDKDSSEFEVVERNRRDQARKAKKQAAYHEKKQHDKARRQNRPTYLKIDGKWMQIVDKEVEGEHYEDFMKRHQHKLTAGQKQGRRPADQIDEKSESTNVDTMSNFTDLDKQQPVSENWRLGVSHKEARSFLKAPMKLNKKEATADFKAYEFVPQSDNVAVQPEQTDEAAAFTAAMDEIYGKKEQA